jgi:serine/threonine protein kinase
MLGDFGETLIVDWGLARKISATSSTVEDSAPESISQNGTEYILSDDAIPESSTRDAQHTREGTIVGTPGYMSPEQATGQVELTRSASDVYSLGATLFCVLTNSVPVEHTGDIDAAGTPKISLEQATQSLREFRADAKTVIHVGGSTQARSHCSPRSVVPSIPPALDAICRRALEDRAELRYASAEDLAADVEAWLTDQPVSVMPESRLQKARRWLRGRPVLAGTMLGSVAIAVIAMAVTLQILAEKNRDISQSLDRETKANRNAQEQAALASRNADDAEKQRQRIQEILHSFITDVERSLANVPGSAVVRKRVLTQVLNQLGVISDSVRGNSSASLSSVMEIGRAHV